MRACVGLLSFMKPKIAAIVTLKQAGAWKRTGHKAIAAWLRKQADHLEQHGTDYPKDRAVQARYCY